MQTEEVTRSREERIMKLEEKWLKERQASQSTLEREEDTTNENIENLKSIIDRLRRVRIKIDQESLRNGNNQVQM